MNHSIIIIPFHSESHSGHPSHLPHRQTLDRTGSRPTLPGLALQDPACTLSLSGEQNKPLGTWLIPFCLEQGGGGGGWGPFISMCARYVYSGVFWDNYNSSGSLGRQEKETGTSRPTATYHPWPLPCM